MSPSMPWSTSRGLPDFIGRAVISAAGRAASAGTGRRIDTPVPAVRGCHSGRRTDTVVAMRSTFADPAVLIRQPTLSSAPGPLPAVRGAGPDTVPDGGGVGRIAGRAGADRGGWCRVV